MKKLFTFFFVVVFFNASNAQDIHLSQFYNSNLLLNPAKTGDFDGDFRFTGNYRNQWREISNPINTYIAAFDKGFNYYSQTIDAGILVARDEFSGFGSVTTKILLSLAYEYEFREHKFRIGIQPGVVFKKTDLKSQTFPTQWDFNTGTFDENTSNLESNIDPSHAFFDLNLGFQWSKKFEKIAPKVGFSINHINRPKDTYFATFTERLRARKVFHTELNWKLNEKLTLEPQLLFMWTTKANDMVLGTNLRHAVKNKKLTSFYYGAHYRHGIKRTLDAVIPTVGLKYKSFDLGFSYDINVSSLSENVKRKTSFEFSIIYIAASSKAKYRTLPCDRY